MTTGESPFYLLYSRDACIPTETAINALHMLDAADYRTELVTGLTEAWNSARICITKAQKKQQVQYDKCAKPPSYRISDRVMVYMPHEMSSKDQKPIMALTKSQTSVVIVSRPSQLISLMKSRF